MKHPGTRLFLTNANNFASTFLRQRIGVFRKDKLEQTLQRGRYLAKNLALLFKREL
jgi:hypothetical protein